MARLSIANKVGINLPIDEIMREINQNLVNEYDEEKKMLIANTIYNSVNNFYRITQTQIDEQIASNGFTYISANTRPGDICWYNGEYMCDENTVKNSSDVSRSEDPHDIIQYIINGFALAYFPAIDPHI